MGQTSYFKQKRSVTGANVCVTQRYRIKEVENADKNLFNSNGGRLERHVTLLLLLSFIGTSLILVHYEWVTNTLGCAPMHVFSSEFLHQSFTAFLTRLTSEWRNGQRWRPSERTHQDKSSHFMKKFH